MTTSYPTPEAPKMGQKFPGDIVGVEYLVSFGIGAMTMTLILLGIYTTVLAFYRRPLPCLYSPGAAGPAFLAGLLWSMGNFFRLSLLSPSLPSIEKFISMNEKYEDK
eukprot:Gb_18399 [translate_table: standard]